MIICNFGEKLTLRLLIIIREYPKNTPLNVLSYPHFARFPTIKDKRGCGFCNNH